MEHSQNNINYKGFRFVSLINSPSYLSNNLTSNGEYYIYVNNTDSQPRAVLYSKDLIEKGEIPQPQIVQWKDQSECFNIKYVKCQDKWYLIIATLKGAQIWNNNATRQLTYVESKKKMMDSKVNFFTCASTGYFSDGEEFIAIGSATGEIYQVQIKGGTSFVKEIGYQVSDQSAITAMSGDPRSKSLAVSNSFGYVLIFTCDSAGEWSPIHSIAPNNDIPVMALSTLMRGDNLYVAGYANGSVKLIHPNGQCVAQIQAHSRMLTSLVCHPTKSVFASVSDDTFLNVFEVSGDRLDKIDVNLMFGSRVNDYQLCGVAFGGEGNNSVVAVPYDFKSVAVWDNMV